MEGWVDGRWEERRGLARCGYGSLSFSLALADRQTSRQPDRCGWCLMLAFASCCAPVPVWCHHQRQRQATSTLPALSSAPTPVNGRLLNLGTAASSLEGQGLGSVWSIEWRRAQTQLLLCLTVGSAARTPKRGGDLMLPVCARECLRRTASQRPPAFRAHLPAADSTAAQVQCWSSWCALHLPALCRLRQH
jgi:hypothetical protein